MSINTGGYDIVHFILLIALFEDLNQTGPRHWLTGKRSSVRFHTRDIHNWVNSQSLGELKLDRIWGDSCDLIGADPFFRKLLRSAI